MSSFAEASVKKLFASRNLTIKSTPDYELFTREKILAEIDMLCKDASEMVSLSPANCKILLHHFKWDLDEFAQKYIEITDLVNQTAGQQGLPSTNGSAPNKDAFAAGDVPELCTASNGDDHAVESLEKLCLKAFTKKYGIKYTLVDNVKEDTVVYDKCKNCKEHKLVVILSCYHLFCFDCWKNYVRHVVTNSTSLKKLPYITCNYEGCTAPIPEEFTRQLLVDEEPENVSITSFVEANPLFKWCPYQGCELAVKAFSSDVEEITCQCGATYCFKCNDIPHSPFPCLIIEKWNAVQMERKKLADVAGSDISIIDCSSCGALLMMTDYNIPLCDGCDTRVKLEFSVFNAVQFEKAKLSSDFKSLSWLESRNSDKAKFLEQAIRHINHYRQIFISFYICAYFVENNTFLIYIQNQIQQKFDVVNAIIFKKFNYDEEKKCCDMCYTRHDCIYTSEEKQNILSTLATIQENLDSQMKRFFEDDLKFKDREIQDAMF